MKMTRLIKEAMCQKIMGEEEKEKEGFWEERCKAVGITLISIKKRNWFICIGATRNYKIKFSYKGKVYSINGWAGSDGDDKEGIYYSMHNFINKENFRTISKQKDNKFKIFLEKYKP